ncbi:MAG TPA: hypothetical protein VMM55_08900 [Thermohalobaculum sp.]|nr:hypothetical protein [Thermohalobaculum sp.]
MRRNNIIIVTAAIAAVLYVFFGAALGEFLDGARMRLWNVPEVETGVEILEPVEIHAVLAALGAQPVPGTDPEAEDRPTLDELSLAAARCTIEQTGGAPPPAAQEALRRYLLMLGAIAVEPDTPLLEPEMAGLTPLFAQGPGEVRRSLTEGDIGEREQLLLAEFYATYAQARHPLYLDLELYDDTFPELNFQALLATVREQPEAVADCAFGRVLGRAGTLPRRELMWRCELGDQTFTMASTVRQADPPVLQLGREGKIEEGLLVETDQGERFEGDGWSFWSLGEAAILELPDGSTAACARREAG